MTHDDLAVVESARLSVATDDGPVRLGVFGAGKAASFHLDAIAHLDGVSITGICSRTGTTAEALATHRDVALATTRPADLIDAGIDAAVVAVSHEQTEQVARLLLEAAVPVLVEKPATPTSAAAQDLAALAERCATLALVGVNRRYYSLVAQALAIVRQRGPVRGVAVEGHEPTDLILRGRQTDPAKIADWFLLNSIHYVDLLRLAGGDVVEVAPMVRPVKVARGDHIGASLRFAGGAIGTYTAHWNSAAPPMLRVYGDDVSAEVRLSPPEDGFVEFSGRRRIRLHADWADTVAKPGVLEQDAAFLVAAAAGRRTAPFPASDLSDHAATLRLVEQILP